MARNRNAQTVAQRMSKGDSLSATAPPEGDEVPLDKAYHSSLTQLSHHSLIRGYTALSYRADPQHKTNSREGRKEVAKAVAVLRVLAAEVSWVWRQIIEGERRIVCDKESMHRKVIVGLVLFQRWRSWADKVLVKAELLKLWRHEKRWANLFYF